MNYINKEVVDRKNYSFELVKACINHEHKCGNLLKKVILSRFCYDKLEVFLTKHGVITPDTQNSTLTCYGVVIERAESASAPEITWEYVEMAKNHDILEQNIANLTKNKVDMDSIIKMNKKHN
jgi:hypothetical protein